MDTYRPYLPLNTLKPVADAVWTVDGPEIGMRYLGTTLPFPTRMTVVRLPSGEIWIHSPTAWDEGLARTVEKLGRVAFLIAPNTLHYWYLPEWQVAFPNTVSYGAPGVARKARRNIRIDRTLGDEPPAEWAGAFDQCLAPGSLLTEVDFFHRASKTLILTDLIENFEPARIRKRWLRWAVRAFGAADPDGKAPYDMQWSFIGHRRELRAAVERMISWGPERILLAHGRSYDRNGVSELRRAFRWVL